MDGGTLLERVREDSETELNRLGSEKALLAATEARLETDAVLVTAAAILAEARGTVTGWADDATGTAGNVLRTTAQRLAEAYDHVAAELDDGVDGAGDLDAVDVPLLSLAGEDDTERVAVATIGLSLVLDRLFLQSVSFFVNEADTDRADRFRDFRGMAEDVLADGQDALDTLCDDDGDWNLAAEAATGAISAAYEDYVDRLDAMGFDPKPIC